MIGEARQAVASALTAAGVTCQPYPPSAFTPPAALLYPGDPYVSGTQLRGSTVELRLRLVGTDAGPYAAQLLDARIDAALAALRAAGIPAGPVPSTTVEDQGGGYLFTDVPITVVWED